MKKSNLINSMGLFGNKLLMISSVITFVIIMLLVFNNIDPMSVIPIIMVMLIAIGAGLGILLYAAIIKFKMDYDKDMAKLDEEYDV